MLFWNGTSWEYREPNTIHDLFGFWGEDANHLHAVGGEGIYRFYNGKEFLRKEDLTEETDSLYGLWGTSNENIYAVGSSGIIMHFNGIIQVFVGHNV